MSPGLQPSATEPQGKSLMDPRTYVDQFDLSPGKKKGGYIVGFVSAIWELLKP